MPSTTLTLAHSSGDFTFTSKQLMEDGLRATLVDRIGEPTLKDSGLKYIHVDAFDQCEASGAFALENVTRFEYRLEYHKKNSWTGTAFKVIKCMRGALSACIKGIRGLPGAFKALAHAYKHPDPNFKRVKEAVLTLQWETEVAAAKSLLDVLNRNLHDYGDSQRSNFLFPDLLSALDALKRMNAYLQAPEQQSLSKFQKTHLLKKEYNACIAQLRLALKSDDYTNNKTDATKFEARFIHQLCAAIWHTDSAPYQTFEAQVRGLQDIRVDRDAVKDHPLYRYCWHRESCGSTLKWALTHMKQAVAARASTGGMTQWQVKKLGLGSYDPIGRLSNHPTYVPFYHMGAHSMDPSYQTWEVYAPTPTCDGEIDPEFCGLLDAILLNKQNPGLYQDVPDYLVYTNYQNINAKGKGGEGDRSVVLMRLLNEEYSEVAFGMTLSQDSSLFKLKEHDNDMQAVWQSAEFFETRMRAHLFDQATYSLENRQKASHQAGGCYLPGTREAWEPLLNVILYRVTEVFRKMPAPQTQEEARDYCIAYQMLVYQLLQSAVAKRAANQLTQIDRPNVLCQASCKEHFDRAAAATAVRRTLLNYRDNTLGFLYGRSLAAAGRMPIKHRLDPVVLTKYVMRRVMKNFYGMSFRQLLWPTGRIRDKKNDRGVNTPVISTTQVTKVT